MGRNSRLPIRTLRSLDVVFPSDSWGGPTITGENLDQEGQGQGFVAEARAGLEYYEKFMLSLQRASR